MSDTSLVFNIIAKDSGVGRALTAIQRAFKSAGDEASASMSKAGSSTANIDKQLDEARKRVISLSQEFEKTGDKKLFGQISRDRSLISTLEKIRGGLKDTESDTDQAASGFSKFAGVLGSVGGQIGGVASQVIGMGGSFGTALGPEGMAVALLIQIAGAALAAGPALYAVGGAAAALPGLLSGGIAALFTLKLGLSGLSENWKKMNTPAAGGGGGGGAAKEDPTPKIRAVQAAQQAVAKSARDLKDAQSDLTDATNDINKARVEEAKRIDDVRRSLADAKADEEDSVQSLAEANMALASAQARGNPDEINRAKIAVDKQTASLADAKAKTKDLQDQNDDAAKKGIEGSDAVVAAKKREYQAQEKVDDAVQAQKNAIQQLGDAQKALNAKIAGAGAAAGGLAAQVPKIAKSAQEFLNELQKLKPAFDALRLDIQQRLFQGLADKLAILAQRWLPALHTSLGAMADTINGVVKTAFDSLSNPTFIKNMQVGVDGFRQALGQIGQAVAGPLVDAWGRLTAAASPFIIMLGGKIAGLITSFSLWIKKIDESGALAKFMQNATHTVGELFDILKDVFRIAGALFGMFLKGPTAAAGGSALDGITNGVHRFANWINDPKTQQSLVKWQALVMKLLIGVKFLVEVLGWWVGILIKVYGWILSNYDAISKWVKDLPGKIGQFFTDIGHWFEALPGQLWNFIKSIPDLVWQVFTAAMSGMAYLVGWGIGELWKGIKALPGLVWAGIKALPGLVWTVIKSMGSFFAQLPGIAWNALKYIGSTIWSALSNLPSLLWNAGYNAVIGLWNGISGLAGWLWSKVQNLGISMWNAFMKGIGAASPSKKFAEAGKWAMLGAAMGLDQHAQTVMDTATGIANDLAGIPLGLNTKALDGQLTAAANAVVQVKANKRQQDVKVTLDVTGGNKEMKTLVQKMIRNDNLLKTA